MIILNWCREHNGWFCSLGLSEKVCPACRRRKKSAEGK